MNYPTLITYDREGVEFQPGFATKWSLSEDERTWTFKTRSGAKWSDGKPLTARDVAWTINTLVKYKDGGTGGVISFTVPNAKAARAVDETTVEIEFNEPTASALDGLVYTVILPEHVWAKHATGRDGMGLTTYANKPPLVSGGPYVWTRHKPGEFAFFEANKNWYGSKPEVETLGFQTFTDEDALITALRTGKIDVVDYLSPGNAGTLKDEENLVVQSEPALSVDNLFINSNPKKRTAKELADVRVREALDMAIDRQQMVDLVYRGNAKPGVSLYPPISKFADKSLEPVPFDIERANEILDGLGYRRGADDVRRANGRPMSYELLFPSFLRGVGDREFKIIRDGWLKLGVKVRQRNVDDAAYRDLIGAPDGKYLDMELAMGSQQPPVDPTAFTRGMTCDAWGESNPAGFCKPEYDRMWAAQQSETDPEKRQQTLNKMWRYIRDQHAIIALVYPNATFAHSRDWTGFRAGPSGWLGNTGGEFMADVRRR